MLQRKVVLAPAIRVAIPDQNIEDGKYRMGVTHTRADYWLHSETSDSIQVLM